MSRAILAFRASCSRLCSTRSSSRDWEIAPTSERIVEDISALPRVLDKIIEARGAVVGSMEEAATAPSEEVHAGPAVHGVEAAQSSLPATQETTAQTIWRNVWRQKLKDQSTAPTLNDQTYAYYEQLRGLSTRMRRRRATRSWGANN